MASDFEDGVHGVLRCSPKVFSLRKIFELGSVLLLVTSALLVVTRTLPGAAFHRFTGDSETTPSAEDYRCNKARFTKPRVYSKCQSWEDIKAGLGPCGARNNKLLGTSASLLVTSALLVVTN